MNDKTRAFCEEVQALLRAQSAESVEAVGPHGNNQFAIRLGGPDDIVLIQLGPGEQIWTPWNQSGLLELNERQKPVVDGLRGIMSRHKVIIIQSIAVTPQRQGEAFSVQWSDQDHEEVVRITQTEIIEPDAAPGGHDNGNAVLATWTVKRGPAKGQAAWSQQYSYTQADYDADRAMQPDPGGEPFNPAFPFAPPHNTFTRRNHDAFHIAFMQPDPGATDWVELVFSWTA